MPTYEYECTSCSYTFDAFQSIKDDPLTECPQCGKKIRRLINGGSGIIFKGSGFYVTDKSKGSSAASINHSKKDGAGDASKQPPSPAASSASETSGGGGKKPADHAQAASSKNGVSKTAKA